MTCGSLASATESKSTEDAAFDVHSVRAALPIADESSFKEWLCDVKGLTQDSAKNVVNHVKRGAAKVGMDAVTSVRNQADAAEVAALASDDSGKGYLNRKLRSALAMKAEYESFTANVGREFTFIDLFAGIGGFRKAFDEQGGKCVLTCEINPYARKTYAANYDVSDHPFVEDITKIDASDVPDHDVLLAGFPCQSFSIAGFREDVGFDMNNLRFPDPEQGPVLRSILHPADGSESDARFLDADGRPLDKYTLTDGTWQCLQS